MGLKCFLKYRKVASSRLVYYSIFDHFWGATNRDVLLLPCQEINQMKGLHEFSSIFVNFSLFALFLKIPLKNVLKSFDGALLLSCKCIFISKNWKKSDSWGSYNSWVSDNSWESYNSWGSYILVGKVDDFRFDLLPCVRYGVHTFCYVATNQDVLLFKLLNFLGVLLTETCY